MAEITSSPPEEDLNERRRKPTVSVPWVYNMVDKGISLIAIRKLRIQPVQIPGIIKGMVMSLIVFVQEPPDTQPASSSVGSKFLKSPETLRRA